MAKEEKVNGTSYLTLRRNEAAELIALLTAQLAGIALPYHANGAAFSTSVWTEGQRLDYCLVITVE